MAKNGQRPSKDGLPLLAVNFFMADMQSGIRAFVGVFLLERVWTSSMVARSLYGTGRINLAQGAIITIKALARHSARAAASQMDRLLRRHSLCSANSPCGCGGMVVLGAAVRRYWDRGANGSFRAINL